MVTVDKTSSGLKRLITPIRGMSCASCASRIEKKVAGLEGVSQVGVNFGAEQASIDYDSSKVTETGIHEVIEKLGFEVPSYGESKAEEVESEDQRHASEIDNLKRRFTFSALVAIAIMFSGMEWVQSFLPGPGSSEHNLLLLILATPVQFWAGLVF